jgi:hypothetical protein
MPEPHAAAPADAASELVALAGSLAALLERETALVRTMQIAAIAPIQAEKLQLTLQFRKALGAQGTAGPAALGTAARLQWIAAGQRLAAAAVDNERALRIGRAATERLVAAMVSAVKQSRPCPAGYSSRRGASPEPPVAGIAVDHRL